MNAPQIERDSIRLEPLDVKHLPDLIEQCNDPALWEFTFQPNPFVSESAAQKWLDEALHDFASVPLAIVDVTSGCAIGSTRYLDIQAEHRKLEIGWTFLAQPYWRTHVNRTVKLMLLEYAFESWNAVRVQFKANSSNQRSLDALKALGAIQEGTLRRFRIRSRDGANNDVTFFSILEDEWPAIKAQLQNRSQAKNA
ncbi:MAG: GNAT family N-acetyltransferase [Vulcanimicrobiaceae bacterium]